MRIPKLRLINPFWLSLRRVTGRSYSLMIAGRSLPLPLPQQEEEEHKTREPCRVKKGRARAAALSRLCGWLARKVD